MQLHDDERSHQLTDGAAAPQSDGRTHSPVTTGASVVGASVVGASVVGASVVDASVARTVTDAPHPAITHSPITYAARTIAHRPYHCAHQSRATASVRLASAPVAPGIASEPSSGPT